MEEESGDSATESESRQEDGRTQGDINGEHSQDRRGLDLLTCLEETGMIWLPNEMFQWHSLRFKQDVLLQTAFVTGHYRREFGRHVRVYLAEQCETFVERILAQTPEADVHEDTETLWARLEKPICRPLWQLCIFRYCNWLLRQLSHPSRLPGLNSDAITPAERRGLHALSYHLIRRASPTDTIQVSPTKGGGGQARLHGLKHAGQLGFAHFPSDHVTRIQLLFD